MSRPHPTSPAADAPALSTADARRLLATQLSLPARIGHTLLLLAALGMTGLAAALLLTEPALPPRTRVAFALIAAVGLAWAVFAAWVLTRRRVLLAGHRVLAARMAVGFSALYTIGALALGVWGDVGVGAYAATGLGLLMLAAAAVLLARARRRVRELERRRAVLERRLRDEVAP